MSQSDRRPGERTSATLPSNPSNTASASIRLPEIVPATIDGVHGSRTEAPARPVSPPPLVLPLDHDGDDAPDPVDTWVEGDQRPVVVPAPSTASTAPLRVVGRRPRVRRVTRVVRHFDPWSVFKLALVFSLVLYGVALTSGVLLWNVALSTGTVDNVERWFTQFGWESFELNGGEIYHNAWIGGLFGAVALTGLAVLVATLFNLVSDLVGGVRVSVLEEEVVERTTSSTRRYVVRRLPSEDGRSGGT